MRRPLDARLFRFEIRTIVCGRLGRVLVFAMLLMLAFAPAACGDESADGGTKRGVFLTKRCGMGCE